MQQLEKFPLLSPLISARETAEWEYALKTDSKMFLEKIEAFVSNVCKEQLSIAVFEKQKIGTCPLCGGAVVEMEKAFSCNQYSVTGCRFTIWKKTYGALLSASDAARLLTGKSVRKKNCKSKTGKVFSCILSLVNGIITVIGKRWTGRGVLFHDGTIASGIQCKYLSLPSVFLFFDIRIF